jgi:hypothetical protein
LSADYLQESGPECCYHDSFWLPRHLKVLDQEDGDEEKSDVGDDVNRSNGLPALELHEEDRKSGGSFERWISPTRLLHPASHGQSIVIKNMDMRAHIDVRARIPQTANLCPRTGDKRRYKNPTEHFERKRMRM